MSTKVCAVVVAFHPDAEFEARLRLLLPQVHALIVVDNTPPDARRHSILLPKTSGVRVEVISNASNAGVGAALNQGLAMAEECASDWLLTLDQDSWCFADHVQILMRVAATCPLMPAMIGSNYIDTRNGVTKVSAGEDGEYLEQKTVITSGCLVDVRVAKALGGFRGDYFIDQLDHEFCLRVRSKGGHVVIARKPGMRHSVGEAGGTWLPGLGYLPNHPPIRKYYLARNSLVTIFRYWREEPDWCLRRLVRLMLGFVLMTMFESPRWVKAQAFSAGIVDALAGRMGVCLRRIYR